MYLIYSKSLYQLSWIWIKKRIEIVFKGIQSLKKMAQMFIFCTFHETYIGQWLRFFDYSQFIWGTLSNEQLNQFLSPFISYASLFLFKSSLAPKLCICLDELSGKKVEIWWNVKKGRDTLDSCYFEDFEINDNAYQFIKVNKTKKATK